MKSRLVLGVPRGQFCFEMPGVACNREHRDWCPPTGKETSMHRPDKGEHVMKYELEPFTDFMI